MEIKRGGCLVLFLGSGLMAHAFQDSNKLVFKPLFPATSFNQLLTECMELWSDIRNYIKEDDAGCYDCIVKKLIQVYSMLISLKTVEHQNIHPGNLEYLLVIFDKMHYESNSNFMRILIRQIKRKIIDLL